MNDSLTAMKMRALAAVSLGGVLLLVPLESRAYLREDHHYSVRVALEALNPPIEGVALVGLCAQLPDEAPELSAIDVYRRLMWHPLDYAAWVTGNGGPAATVGRMATIQQLLHGLTGGNSQGVREVSKNIVRDILGDLRSLPKGAKRQRADALCALGFAFHLYGDSFSHQRIKNPARMYGTGIGHLFDSTMPDLPLFSAARLELWRRYVASLPDLVPHAGASDIRPLMAEAGNFQPSARKSNGFNLAALRRLIIEQLRTEGADEPIVAFDPGLKGKGCQAMLDRQAAVNGFDPAPSCERVWAIFRDRALQEYNAYDGDRRHAGRLSRADSKAPYFMESPFSKGPKW